MVDAEELTRRWLHECVLALGLCPFAAPVLRDEALRVSVSAAADSEAQLLAFKHELELLLASPETELATTLLVYDAGPEDFMAFLELLARCQRLLERAGLLGVVQLASFHPHYLFAAEPSAALSHFTNRSPRPTIHLLREAMMSEAVARHPHPEQIPQDNIARLDAMGRDAVLALWGSCGVVTD